MEILYALEAIRVPALDAFMLLITRLGEELGGTRRTFGGLCTEMEGASIAHACYRMNVPFASIRIISDILDSENHIADYSAFEKDASALASNIALKVINILCK